MGNDLDNFRKRIKSKDFTRLLIAIFLNWYWMSFGIEDPVIKGDNVIIGKG